LTSSFDSPNFTRNHAGHYDGCDDPNCLKREWAKRWDRDKDTDALTLAVLPNKEWVDERRQAWGEDSPLWMSKVLGEFPLQSVNTLFSRDTLNKGINADIQKFRTTPVILGVDLSRLGPDYSAIYKNEGGNVRLVDMWGGKADETNVDGMESAQRVHQHAISLGASEVRIDAEGIGGPILDQITRLSEGQYTVIAMRGSQASPDNLRWVNARAYWYDKAREDMLNEKIDFDPRENKGKQLEYELEQIQYHFNNRYKSLQIESKEDMAKRGLKSPDFADAFIYAVADMEYVTKNPLSRFQYGDRVSMTTEDFLGIAESAGFISPY
jgi:phage terminase large subunit